MKKIASLLAAALCLAATPASAAYVTGKDLASYCQSGQQEALYSCVSYITGVIDYHTVMQALGTTPTTDFCLPATLPAEKAAAVVVAYLKKSPQHEAFIAAPVVTLALHEAYPCAKR